MKNLKQRFLQIGLLYLVVSLVWPSIAFSQCVDPDGDGYGMRGDKPCRTRRVRRPVPPDSLSVTSSQTSSITSSSVTITANFSDKASGRIEFGTTNKFGSYGPYSGFFKKTTLSQTLRNLDPDTTYYYRVVARSGSNKALSETKTFKTLNSTSPSTTIPPTTTSSTTTISTTSTSSTTSSSTTAPSTAVPSDVAYTGVSDVMWNEINQRRSEFGDTNDCQSRVESIPTNGFELAPCQGNCVNDALANHDVVKLLPGVFTISSPVSIVDKILIGAHPTNVVIDASQVDTGVWVQEAGKVSNLTIIDARNTGLKLGDDTTSYRISVKRTGYSAHSNDNGAGVHSYNRSGNCVVSVEVMDGYNEDGKGCSSCYNGGNADGFKISFGSGETSLIDCHATRNSDDGYDFWRSDGSNFIYYSTAFNNGEMLDGRVAGDGNGFKLGIGNVKHYLFKSKAFNNPAHGFDVNGNQVTPLAVECESYNNGKLDWHGIERVN